MDLDASVVDLGRGGGGGGGNAAAYILVCTFCLEDWLEGCVAKYDACCEETVYDCRQNLYCRVRERSADRSFGLGGGGRRSSHSQSLFHLGTSNAPTDSMYPGLPA